MRMPYGWTGNILYVDLTKEKIAKESTMPYTRDFMGGRGIAAKIIYDEMAPKIGPYTPESILIFSTGPLTGTAVPGSGKALVTAKSPMSGFLCESSIGGRWGPELKFAGYDHIVVKGKAKKPVYVLIDNENVEIKDASGIWGKNTFETQEKIRKETGYSKSKIVCIGPAGETLVKFANIISETGFAAGRGGMGAVMGSKLLKAVAVRGENQVALARPEEFSELTRKAHRIVRECPMFQEYAEWGSARINLSQVMTHIITFGNYEETDWPPFLSLDAESFVKEYSISGAGCFGCPMACMNLFMVPSGGVVIAKCADYLSLINLVWNTDLTVFLEGIALCNKYGIDAIETGGSIAFLMELYRRGVITEKDTDGVPMERGSKEAILATIHKIGRREGFGNILAEGIRSFAKKVGRGAEEFVVHGKGFYPHGYLFQAFKATALLQAVGQRAGDPFPTYGTSMEMGAHWKLSETESARVIKNIYERLYGSTKALIPTEYEGKAIMIVDTEHRERVPDMMGTCLLYVLMVTPSHELTAALFSAVTGVDVNEEELLKAAERVRNIERAFDVREGINRQVDTLPKRFFEEPLQSGTYKGEVIDRRKFEEMKDEYYMLRGWDIKTGIPTRNKLLELNLKEVADDLHKLHGQES